MVELCKEEAVICPLCQDQNPFSFYQENGYTYWRCSSCKLMFLWPRPGMEMLKSHYQEYLPADAQGISRWYNLMQPIFKDTARYLHKLYPSGGSLLDVGCGFGFFLQEMQSLGWEVIGVELSKSASEIARKKTGVPVFSTPVEENCTNQKYDVISMFYVIEHLAEPWNVLASLRHNLKDDGLMVLRYPNTTPLIRICPPLARKLKLMQAPSHIYDFSAASLATMLKYAGFTSYETFLNANTRPENWIQKNIAKYSQKMASLISWITKNRVLLPGISRTTYASISGSKFRKKL